MTSNFLSNTTQWQGGGRKNTHHNDKTKLLFTKAPHRSAESNKPPNQRGRNSLEHGCNCRERSGADTMELSGSPALCGWDDSLVLWTGHGSCNWTLLCVDRKDRYLVPSCQRRTCENCRPARTAQIAAICLPNGKSVYTNSNGRRVFLGGWGITVADFQSCVGHLNIPVSDK